jgi:multiple sugar transport system substrate-binding protein
MSRNGLSRRNFLKMSALSTLGLGLAACVAPQVGPQSAQSDSDTPDQAATEVRWHHRLGGWAVYTERIAAFEEVNPGAKIVVEEFPAGSAEYGPKIIALVASGLIGDATWLAIGSGSFQFLAQNNAIAPLDDLIAADGSGFTLDGYYPRTVESLTLDGSLYGLPELAHATHDCLFFNRDLLEAEGVEGPSTEWTRDDLLTMAMALTTEDRFGFLPAVGDHDATRIHTLPYGGELLSEDGTTSLIDSDGVKEGIRWVHSTFFDTNVAPTPQQMPQQDTGGGREQMFLAGNLASFQSGGWSLSIKNVVEDAFVWDMVLMPKGPAGVSGGHLNVDGESVTAASPNKDLAYEFCKYLTDFEAGVGIGLEIGLAARPDVYEDPRITENPYLVLLGESTAAAAPHINPANLRKQEMQTTIRAIFDPLWVGDMQPDDAFFAQASGTFQEFLDKPRE